MFIPPVRFLLLTAIKRESLCTCFKNHSVVSWIFLFSYTFCILRLRLVNWMTVITPLSTGLRTRAGKAWWGGESLPATQGKEPLDTSRTTGLGFPVYTVNAGIIIKRNNFRNAWFMWRTGPGNLGPMYFEHRSCHGKVPSQDGVI